MAFFKKYNGSTDTKLVRIERLIWVLIYGGLLSCVIGYFMPSEDAPLAGTLQIAGLLAVAAGAVLIYVRSRLHEEDR